MRIKELPRIEGFDFEYAMNIFQDEEILKIILIDFYDSMDEICVKLNGLFDAIREEDNLSLYRLEVHALKSTSASVGALEISAHARSLEEAAIAGDIGKIQTLHPILIEEITEHRERLLVIVPKAEEKETAPESIIPYFDVIKNYLLDFDINAADPLCQEIQRYRFPDEIQPLVDEMLTQVFQLETDEAIVTIEKIQKKW